VRGSVEGDWPARVGSDSATAGFLFSKVVPRSWKSNKKLRRHNSRPESSVPPNYFWIRWLR